MLVRKILETTLTAGNTSVIFTDSDIPNSLLRVYSTNSDLFPLSQTISGNNLTITYEAQASNIGVALEIVKQGLEIVDNVTSTDTDKALSANQGKVLKDAIDNIVIPTVPENISDLADVDITDIENNQILAWDSVSQKFVNTDPAAGGDVIYSTTEQKIGKWTDNTDVYRAVVTGLNVSVPAVDSWSAVFADSLNINVLIDIDYFTSGGIKLEVEQTQVLDGGIRILRMTNTLPSRVIDTAIIVYTKNTI